MASKWSLPLKTGKAMWECVLLTPTWSLHILSPAGGRLRIPPAPPTGPGPPEAGQAGSVVVLERIIVLLAGAHLDDMVHIGQEDLPIP